MKCPRTIASILLVFMLIMLLTGCEEKKSYYERLSDSQKSIIDNIYSNREMWEITDFTYGGIHVKGESHFRNVWFTDRSGEVIFVAIRSIDGSGVDCLQDEYKCSGASLIKLDTYIMSVYESNMPKKYDTSWDEDTKKNYLAEKLFVHLYK